MADNIKRADAFINSKKIAELESSDMSLNTNGEQQHGAEGVLAITTGNPEVEWTFNTIRLMSPKAGVLAMEDAVENQTLVTLAYRIGTKLKYAACKCVSLRYSSESRSGTLKGVYVFKNAENPKTAS